MAPEKWREFDLNRTFFMQGREKHAVAETLYAAVFLRGGRERIWRGGQSLLDWGQEKKREARAGARK